MVPRQDYDFRSPLEPLIALRPNTYHLYTFGCKVNQYESQLLREELAGRGWSETSPEQAAWQVVNGCVVTQAAQTECRRLVQRLIQRYAQSRVLVTGCAGTLAADNALSFPEHVHIVPQRIKEQAVSVICGGGHSFNLPSRNSPSVRKGVDNEADAAAAGFALPRSESKDSPVVNPGSFKKKISRIPSEDYICRSANGFSGHTRAFVKVQDGCDRGCSYCIVPRMRGRSISKPLSIIIKEVTDLGSRGFKEIVLTGIDLGSWGGDCNPRMDIALLVRKLLKIRSIQRIRLSSIEVTAVTPELIAMIASSAMCCPHLHIPLQSGDDEILQRMNRPYTRKAYCAAIDALRRAIPRLTVSTDILVGFPGETEAQFKNTLRVCQDAGFIRGHVFGYSRRPNTAACRLAEVDGRTIKRRGHKARGVIRASCLAYCRTLVNTVQSVLIEERQRGRWNGYTDTYIPVSVASRKHLAGEIAAVRITRASQAMIEGKIVETGVSDF